MNKIILILFMFSLNLSAQEKIFSLKESLEIGIQNSKELKIAESQINSSIAQFNEINSARLPNLSLSAGYTRLSEVPPFSINIPFSPLPVTIQESVLNNYSLKASIEQVLFTGFKLSSLSSSANYLQKSSEINLLKEKNNKAFEILSSYWNYYKLKQTVKLFEENLSALNKHLDDTKNFLDNGLVTENDYLKIDYQISNLELKLIEAKNNRDIAKSFFAKTIGISFYKDFDIEENLPETKTYNYNLNNLLEEGFNKREELLSIQSVIKAYQQKNQAAKADYFPQLFAFSNFYYNRPNQRFLPLEDKLNDSWDVGIALKWNIWNGGNTIAKVQQASEELFRAEESYKILEENIELEIYKNYLTYKSELQKLQVSQAQLKSATENYRITKEKYNNQIASSTDLIDSDVELLNAQTMLSNSIIDLEIARLMLEKSIGNKIY